MISDASDVNCSRLSNCLGFGAEEEELGDEEGSLAHSQTPPVKQISFGPTLIPTTKLVLFSRALLPSPEEVRADNMGITNQFVCLTMA